MPYIIDGNNLIGCTPDISFEDADAREKLLHIVRKFQESRNSNIFIVFDGDPCNSPYRQTLTNKFTVIYPRMGYSADDEIRKLLGNYHDCRDVVLVSSDRALKDFARKKGAKIINSIEFYFELKRVYHINGKKEESLKRINTSLSKNEVDQWLKIFNGN